MKVSFDVKHLYYLPQYLPVYEILREQEIDCEFTFYQQADKSLNEICKAVIKDSSLNAKWCANWSEALNHYKTSKPTWIIFGNSVSDIEALHVSSKTAFMHHGIGPKQCYYTDSDNLTTVRFVEGDHRLKRLQEMYPEGNFIDTGFSKLDPAFRESSQTISLQTMGLDPNKKTILYAPTFYPSSVERFPNSFPKEFSNYNIILKPHFFSLTHKRYKQQKRLLESWASSDNVYLASTKEYSLVPFMLVADLMLSEASSAVFEFAALDKPVIWCDFYKLRWNYRGIFSYRFKRRMDQDLEIFHEIADQIKSYDELAHVLERVIHHPDAKQQQRKEITEKLAGKTDGRCSQRVVEYLLANG